MTTDRFLAHSLLPYCVILAVIASPLTRSESQAQDPKKLFPHDYVNQGLKGADGEDRGAAAAGPVQVKRSQGIHGAAPASVPSRPSGGVRNPRAPTAQVQDAPVTLSVYVNSLDKRHFEQVVKHVMKVVDAHLARVSVVVHIGDYRSVSPELRAALNTRAIGLNAAKVVPSWYPITQSPAWIFHEGMNIRVVEGVMAIERFIDGTSGYREAGDGELLEVPPTPVPVQISNF